MIDAYQKPIEELRAMLASYSRILILGCESCKTVCLDKGVQGVSAVADMLLFAGIQVELVQMTVKQQCDPELLSKIEEHAAKCDAILSLACGEGVQCVAARFPKIPVFPSLNTTAHCDYEAANAGLENCQACGDCQLAFFAGVCPLTRCSKSGMNGPCEGSNDGKCEGDPEKIVCAWQIILTRMESQGRLEELAEPRPLPNHAPLSEKPAPEPKADPGSLYKIDW